MPYTSTSMLLDDRKDMPRYDTTLNQWHLRIHLLLCVWDSFCKDILKWSIESY